VYQPNLAAYGRSPETWLRITGAAQVIKWSLGLLFAVVSAGIAVARLVLERAPRRALVGTLARRTRARGSERQASC